MALNKKYPWKQSNKRSKKMKVKIRINFKLTWSSIRKQWRSKRDLRLKSCISLATNELLKTTRKNWRKKLGNRNTNSQLTSQVGRLTQRKMRRLLTKTLKGSRRSNRRRSWSRPSIPSCSLERSRNSLKGNTKDN